MSTVAYRWMKEKGMGRIVNIASIFGLVAAPTAIAYATTKHALVGYSKTLAIEAATAGIQVHLVCPGFIDSNFFDNAKYIGVDKQKIRSRNIKTISVQEAVQRTMKGIERDQRLIIFPWSARVLYFLERYFPWVAYWLLQQSWEEYQGKR